MIDFLRDNETESENSIVRYEDFGAIGGGIADDSAAIRAAHEVANLHDLRVLGTAGKSYRIGIIESPIIVKTEVRSHYAMVHNAVGNDLASIDIFSLFYID